MKLTSSLSYSGHLFWPDQQDFLLWSWVCSGFFSCLVVFLEHKIGRCLLMIYYKYHSPQHYDLIWFQAVAGMCVCVCWGKGIPGGTSVDQLQWLSTDISEWMMKFSFSLSETSPGKCHITHVYTHKHASAVCWHQWKKAEKYPHLCFCLYTNVWKEVNLSDKTNKQNRIQTPDLYLEVLWELTDKQWDTLTIAHEENSIYINYRT